MLVFFVLLTVIVQVGFLVVARTATATAVEAAIRDVALEPDSLGAAEVRLHRDLLATVPGVEMAEVSVTSDGQVISGSVEFDWVPPGPDFVPIRIVVHRSGTVAVPP